MSGPGISAASTASQMNTPAEEEIHSALSEENKADGQPYSDLAMINLCRTEQERAVGFENDQVLRTQRVMALDMFKGDMKAYIPSLPNRSSAVSSDVADAVETILPDLMEIFTAQGDVATFKPVKPGDEDAAQQETDYLQHVLFQDNDGFFQIMNGLKDGLLQKVCLWEYAWKKDHKDERFEGKSLQDLLAAHASGEVFDVSADDQEDEDAEDEKDSDADANDESTIDSAADGVKDEPDEDEEPSTPSPIPQQTYSFTVRQNRSKCEFWAHPGEDFAVSPETTRLPDATYCVARYRPRVQDLIADGYDEEAVKRLEAYVAIDQVNQQARDTVGEHMNSQEGDFTNQLLRQVEIRKHYIKLLRPKGDGFDLWRVVTNRSGDVGIPKDGKLCHKVGRIPFAAGSPYVIPHRFYGFSVADQMIETAKIKTVLRRALLDTSYFALNQRYEINMAAANDYTISDLLRNEPMVPVRSKDGNAVRQLNSASLGFDAYAALEYFSTEGEQRSGVMRNAQGLNPDTLHDTKGGMLALLQASQRRTRMIARVLAETCFKDLYLGVHATIREHAEEAVVTQINGRWVQIDPTSWGERSSMSIEIGLGSAGRDQELAQMQAVIQTAEQVITMQGGLNGPLITADNAFNILTDLAKSLGRKQPQRYFSDPKNAPPQQPQPDPKLQIAQLQMQMKQQQMQMQSQQAAHAQQMQMMLKQQQMQQDGALKKYQIDQAMQTDIQTSLIGAHARHLEGGNVNQVDASQGP